MSEDEEFEESVSSLVMAMGDVISGYPIAVTLCALSTLVSQCARFASDDREHVAILYGMMFDAAMHDMDNKAPVLIEKMTAVQ